MNNSVPSYVWENGLALEIPLRYRLKYGNYQKYVESFFEDSNGRKKPRPEYLDMISHVPSNKSDISFVTVNDASVASRRYQESYICQTPLYYAYEDLLRFFNEKIPKVRQRNATKSFFEPLIPEICAKRMILCALIEAVEFDGKKSITLTLTSKSLKVNYSFIDDNSERLINTRKEYFDVFNVDMKSIEKEYELYAKQHRTIIRSSFSNEMKTLEVLFNVRATTFKKYMVVADDMGLLSKSEYDIYNLIKNRGGSSLKLLTDELGYNSSRAAKYHVDKLIRLNLIQRVGLNKSHNCFYKIV